VGHNSGADKGDVPIAFDEAQTVPELLAVTARSIVGALGASACTISRAIGDLLVDLVDYSPSGDGVQIGHGYLISDYPETRAVLESLESRTIFVGDANADKRETGLLRELGFDSLLMLPLEIDGDPWGLVEVYDNTRMGFTATHVATAQRLVAQAAAALARLDVAS